MILEKNDLPDLLLNIKNSPKCLYYLGDKSLLKEKCISIVGTRNASKYGKYLAKKIASILVLNGYTVVSGMANGIDEFAHLGAIKIANENNDKRIKSIAVLGSGINYCYPKRNKYIYDELIKRGLVVSEQCDKTSPKPYFFPNRNRIISGLSIATIVIEAGLKSGSLITAELASEQGREVFTIPWSINKEYSLGCNKLIKDGVTPLITPYDILEYLLPLCKKSKKTNGKLSPKDSYKLSRNEELIFKYIFREGEVDVDTLNQNINININDILSSLTSLELKGLITSEVGKFFILN